MDKSLKTKAIDFKGKGYVLVSDRVIYFNETYPNGAIQTEIISPLEAERVIVRAIVTPDCSHPERLFSDYSQAKWGEGYINKTSAIENACTSAVGRALAYMGIGVIDSIASIDEINKANSTINNIKQNKPITAEEYELTQRVNPQATREVVKTVHAINRQQPQDYRNGQGYQTKTQIAEGIRARNEVKQTMTYDDHLDEIKR